MTARTFIDANILVYAYDSHEPQKQERAECVQIFSEDFNSDQLYNGVVAVNPFRRSS